MLSRSVIDLARGWYAGRSYSIRKRATRFVPRSYCSIAAGIITSLREITKGAFDLIICDMMMPGEGGEMVVCGTEKRRENLRSEAVGSDLNI